MKFYRRGSGRFFVLAVVMLFLGRPTVAQQPATFGITVSLPESTMHVGEDLLVRVITSNPTDHIVFAGAGYGGGVIVELLNEKGEDLGLHAMGGKSEPPVATLHSNKLAIRPHNNNDFTWRFKPEPGYLVPGIYKLRVHKRDMKSHADVYSNTVTLTVIP
ncbi:MAG: hypothetical protein ABI286_12265 [Edaphobacter sp.]